MKSLFIVFGIFIFSQGAYSKDLLLRQYCNEKKGHIVHSYKCPKSRLVIPFDFCVFEGRNNQKLFFDGCTGPSGGFASFFYPVCIKHDLCYHHEPATYGKEQKQCDDEFLDGALSQCEKSLDRKKCRFWAKSMYLAIRLFGKLAYHCSNVEYNYEL